MYWSKIDCVTKSVTHAPPVDNQTLYNCTDCPNDKSIFEARKNNNFFSLSRQPMLPDYFVFNVISHSNHFSRIEFWAKKTIRFCKKKKKKHWVITVWETHLKRSKTCTKTKILPSVQKHISFFFLRSHKSR